MDWDKIIQVFNLILWGLFLIYFVYIFIKYFFKPRKLFKADKILFSNAYIYGYIITIAIVFAIVGMNMFYNISSSSNRDILTPFIFGFIVFCGKTSDLIITEKKIYIQRQTINADDIEEIKKNSRIGFKVADIIRKNGKGVSMATPKKVLKAIKQFCEINGIEFKE